MKKLLLTLCLLLSLAAPALAVSPTYVQGAYYPVNLHPKTTDTAYIFDFPNTTGAGNCLLVFNQDGGATYNISDDSGSNVWGASSVTITNGQIVTAWVLPNAAAARKITLTRAAGTTGLLGVSLLEYRNCPTTSPVDVTFTLSAASPTANVVTWGSNTTTVNADTIVCYAADTGGNDALNYGTFTAGNSGVLRHKDPVQGQAVQEIPQATAGAIAPSLNVNNTWPTHAWAGVCVALKGGTTGGTTPPAGQIRVASKMIIAPGTGTPTTFNLQFPTTGNAGVLAHVAQPGGATNSTLSALTTDSTSWTLGVQKNDGVIGVSEIYYRCPITPSGTSTGSATVANAFSASFHDVVTYYDIVNAASGCFDTSASTNGVQSVTGNITGVSITPLSQPGMAFFDGTVNLHCISGTTTDTTIPWQGARSAGEDGGDTTWSQCDPHAISTRFTSLTAIQPVWTTQNNSAGVQQWTNTAVTIKEAVAAAACSSYQSLTGVGC